MNIFFVSLFYYKQYIFVSNIFLRNILLYIFYAQNSNCTRAYNLFCNALLLCFRWQFLTIYGSTSAIKNGFLPIYFMSLE